MSHLPPGESRGFFPAPWRQRTWSRLAAAFDVVVVGGGITGAGVARDAALRGLRVALLERGDFAGGTSSRSSRLVHGGVRYLEHGHLHLVLESSRERRTLLRIAPHLVRPLAFTWPVYSGARLPSWKLNVGLAFYDALALFRKVARFRRLAPDEVRQAEPHLLREGLRGGARYFDAATDDARLVLANVVAAAEQGAVVLNYAEVQKVSAGRGAWEVRLQDVVTGSVHTVLSRAVVFAVGPWSEDVPAIIGHEAPKARVTPSAGAHIALERSRVGNRGALTLTAPGDGRVFFVLPAGRLTIVTTTEALARTSPENVRATRADVEYLLAALAHYFPAAGAGPQDVVAAWAGVRPLAVPNAGALTSASREHQISQPAPQLYVVTGGKLTTFRAMAEEIVDRLARALLPRFRRAVTQHVPLPGGELADVPAATANAMRIVGDQGVAERLIHAYGSRWPLVWSASPESAPVAQRRIVAQEPYLLGEIDYAIEREFAVTLADLLIRRIPMAYDHADHAVAAAQRVAGRLAIRFGWALRDIDQALQQYRTAIERQFGVDDAERLTTQHPPSEQEHDAAGPA